MKGVGHPFLRQATIVAVVDKESAVLCVDVESGKGVGGEVVVERVADGVLRLVFFIHLSLVAGDHGF